MGVILESERRGWKARGFLFLIYALLTLGALTMVYPFAVMLTASCSSSYDYARHSPVLDVLFDRSDRFMRSIALRFRVFPRALYPEAPRIGRVGNLLLRIGRRFVLLPRRNWLSMPRLRQKKRRENKRKNCKNYYFPRILPIQVAIMIRVMWRGSCKRNTGRLSS